jgi:hypothetical protein
MAIGKKKPVNHQTKGKRPILGPSSDNGKGSIFTVTVGATATIRVGDHEFIRPEIVFHNLDPRKNLEWQIKEGLRVVDKAWPVVIQGMQQKVEEFKE